MSLLLFSVYFFLIIFNVFSCIECESLVEFDFHLYYSFVVFLPLTRFDDRNFLALKFTGWRLVNRKEKIKQITWKLFVRRKRTNYLIDSPRFYFGFRFSTLFVCLFYGVNVFIRLSLLLAVFRLIDERFAAATCSIRFGRKKKRKCDVVRSVRVFAVVVVRCGWACVFVHVCRWIECGGKSEKRHHIIVRFIAKQVAQFRVWSQR